MDCTDEASEEEFFAHRTQQGGGLVGISSLDEVNDDGHRLLGLSSNAANRHGGRNRWIAYTVTSAVRQCFDDLKDPFGCSEDCGIAVAHFQQGGNFGESRFSISFLEVVHRSIL